MKNLRSILSLLFLCTGLSAAAPRFYVTGQIGRFEADAGTAAAYGPYIERAIKSGPKTFSDWAVGAELLDWLSLEAGYVDFASFSSENFVLQPYVLSIRAEALWQTYDLRGFRLTPVIRVYSNDRFALKLLGGLIRSVGRLTQRDRFWSGYERTIEVDDLGYHIGAGLTYNLTKQAALEGRFVHYDFGKPGTDPNRITAMTYSLGFAWRF